MVTAETLRRAYVCAGVTAAFLFPGLLDQHGFAHEGIVSFAVKDVRVFDGKTTLPRATVVVENGRITAVKPDAKVPDGAEVVDGKGRTLLPGFIDCHTHVFDPAQLHRALVFGVTTEMDMGCGSVKVIETLLKEQADDKAIDRADVFSAGTLVTVPGGHGTEYGVDIPTITRPEQAQEFVDARIREGSDYIKIIYGGKPRMDKSVLSAVIRAAHERHKLAIVHVDNHDESREALEAGADGLAHVVTDRAPEWDLGKLAAKHEAFVITTLTMPQNWCGEGNQPLSSDARLAPYIDAADEAMLAAGGRYPGDMMERAYASLRQLTAAGVTILAGTDASNPGAPHGIAIHRELELLVKGGMSPQASLAAATSVPAKVFALNDRGLIAPGRRGDLVLVSGDPTVDITATRDIVAIWKCGVRLDRKPVLRVQPANPRDAATAKLRAQQGASGGLVSDFEDGTLSAAFGFGWQLSTDQIKGGTSTAEFKVVPEGAERSKYCLSVSGKIGKGFDFPWAGVMFCPGPYPMTPKDLSHYKKITFWVKGDRREISVMLFAQSRGYMPLEQRAGISAEWKKVSLELSKFDGADGSDLVGVLFSAGAPSGDFSFQIDDVRFE